MCSFKEHEHVNSQQANNMTMAQEKLQTWKVLARATESGKKKKQWVDTVPVLTMFMMAATSLLGSCQARFFPETHIHMSMYACTHIHRINTHSVWLVNHTVFWPTQRWMNKLTNCWQWKVIPKHGFKRKIKFYFSWNKIKPFVFLSKDYPSNVQVNKIKIHL